MADDALVGTTLGNYRLGTRLGEGGMGGVYYATHVTIGRAAAVKVLHAAHSDDAELIQRFLNEARAASALRHPHIVDVLDVGEQGGRHYMIMEMLVGETLAARLHREGPLSAAAALPLICQITDALDRAHQRGVVHRDLKPDNIFLLNSPDHPRDHVKVLDFGIAKLATAPADKKTQAGVLLGTPHYMSPEQCLGEADLDHRSDVYSLGVVLYEVLTGVVPFDGAFGRVLADHVHTQPTPPAARNPKVPAAVSGVVLLAMAKRREDRYAGALELQRALLAASAAAAAAASAPPAPPAGAIPTIRLLPTTAPAPAAAAPAPVAVRALATPLPVDRFAALVEQLERLVATRLEKDRVALPAISPTAEAFFAAIDDDRSGLDAIAREVERDRAFGDDLLAVAKRRYGVGGTATRCLHQLGVKRSRLVVWEVAAKRVYAASHGRVHAVYPRLVDDVLAVAVATRRIAEELARPELTIEAAFVAALLSQVGRPILGAFLAETEVALHAGLANGRLPDHIWHRLDERFGRAIPGRLARRWKLGDEISAALVGLWVEEGQTHSITTYVRLASAICAGDEGGRARLQRLLGLSDQLVQRIARG